MIENKLITWHKAHEKRVIQKEKNKPVESIWEFQIGQSVTFADLVMIKSKSNKEIEKFLKKNNYSLIDNNFKNQWQSARREDLIQFSGEGGLVFVTYNLRTFNNFIADLDKFNYEIYGEDTKGDIKLKSYIKNEEMIFLTTALNPNNGKKAYSFTFMK